MASVSVFALTRFTSLAAGDVIPGVDISDTTQNAHGSLDAITVTNFFATIPVPVVVTSASANALAVGLAGATNPAFAVDASTALQVAGLKVTGAVTGGTVALVTTDSGAATNLTINAKGTGTIGIGSVSTGRVTITPVTTITGLLTLTAGLTGAVPFAGLATFNAGATIASGQTLTVTGATITGLTAASVATGTFPGVYTVTGALTLSAALTYGGVTLSNAVTGTGNMVLSAGPTFTGTLAAATITASATIALGANPAASGVIKIPNNQGIQARNAANNADLNIAFIDGSNVLQIGGGAAGVAVSAGTTAVQALTATTGTFTGDVKINAGAGFVLNGATATVYVQNDSGTHMLLQAPGGVTCSAGISATTGTFSGAAVAATVRSASATAVSVPSATATTILALGSPTVNGESWLVSYGSTVVNSSGMVIVSVANSAWEVTFVLGVDDNFDMSGNNLRLTQISGSTLSYNVRAIHML